VLEDEVRGGLSCGGGSLLATSFEPCPQGSVCLRRGVRGSCPGAQGFCAGDPAVQEICRGPSGNAGFVSVWL